MDPGPRQAEAGTASALGDARRGGGQAQPSLATAGVGASGSAPTHSTPGTGCPRPPRKPCTQRHNRVGAPGPQLSRAHGRLLGVQWRPQRSGASLSVGDRVHQGTGSGGHVAVTSGRCRTATPSRSDFSRVTQGCSDGRCGDGPVPMALLSRLGCGPFSQGHRSVTGQVSTLGQPSEGRNSDQGAVLSLGSCWAVKSGVILCTGNSGVTGGHRGHLRSCPLWKPVGRVLLIYYVYV